MSTIVHVIDDDPAIRDSLRFLLSTENIDAATYESAFDFLAIASTLNGGCVVTDVRMPDMSGPELVRKLNEIGALLPVVMITGHGDVPLAVEAMKAGVRDFIEKPFTDVSILAAVRAALSAGVSSAAGVERLQTVRARVGTLTDREREVFDALVLGHANKVIAASLGISPRTIEVYRANVMTKMQAASLADLVRDSIMLGKG